MREDRKLRSEQMDRTAAGQDGAFGQLATAVQDDLYRFAIARGLNRHDAAEAVQETLMRAFEGRRRWRTGADVTGWLYGIEMNVVREWLRRGRRASVGLDLDSLADSAGAPMSRGLARTSDVADRADGAARRQALAEALATLPPRQQEAVTCRYLLEMSLKETADVMDCAEGTVKAAVFAALENLRKVLPASDEGEERSEV